MTVQKYANSWELFLNGGFEDFLRDFFRNFKNISRYETIFSFYEMKLFIFNIIIYNIHIYNLSVDARIHALQARSNSRNACIRAYTCSRLIYFSGSSIHSLTLSRSRSTHSLGHARTRSLCVRGTIYIFYRV